jgi:hypothetical protein
MRSIPKAHQPSSEEDDMSPRKLAIAGSVAALSLAAVPIAQAASTPHHKPAIQVRVDRSRDQAGLRHANRTRDASRDTKSADLLRDMRSR